MSQLNSPYWFTVKLSIALVLGVLQLSPAIAVPPCDLTPDPCFTNVSDILEGRRQLLPTDDLLLTGTFRVDTQFFQDTDIWTLLTTNSEITSQSKFGPYAKVDNINSDTPEYNSDSRTGRMFNMPNDVAVTVAPNGEFGNLKLIVKIKDITGTYTFADLIVGFSQNSVLQSIAVGDADGDGFDDLFVSFAGGEFGGVTIALTAKDVNDPSKGLETRVFGFVKDNCPYAAMALGNLTKSVQGRTSFVGVITSEASAGCALLSGQKPPLLCASLIDQESLALDTDSTTCISHPNAENAIAVDLAVGNFDGTVGDEAVWVVGQSAARTGPNIFAIDFTLSTENKLIPAMQDTLDLDFFPNFSDKVVVDSGRLDWFGTSEQAVVGFNGFLGTFDASMLVLTFDNNLNITNKKNKPTRIVAVGQESSFHDLAVGNFDNRISDDERDFNQEIAVLHHDSADFFVDIYDVDVKKGFSLTEQSFVQVNDFEGQFPGKRRLAAGDLQGRSMRLGPPTKLTISHHSQPNVVLGMPAMHIDYIRDVDNLPVTKPGSAPSILNLTTLPTLFFSQYDTDVKGGNQSSNKSTTSYGTSTKKTVSGKVSFGIPDIASVKASFSAATGKTHDNTVANKHNTYQSKDFDVSKKTGLSDFLWFTSKRFNVFYYQVLGQTICPQDPANTSITPINCPEDEKLPLHIQFSGPDSISANAVSGTVVEWYQPATEPANVFSYPWNQAQLEALSPPGFKRLSSETWVTDDSTSVVSINWEEGSTTSKTTGSTSTHSFDKSASASASVSIDGFGGGASAKVDYNSSNSVSTQNTSTDSLGSSTGIQIAKPPFAMTGDYGYNGETFIFGQQPSTATLQKIPLDEEFKANGILTVASTVNPLGPNSGDWWEQAYTRPDIAVNHPQRWDWKPPLSPSQPDRVTFYKADTVDPALSEFYFMRGLFITPLEANGKGPQRTNANEGEQLKIEARVYNYSLVDMPAGSTVRVRFFVQEWDNTESNFTGLSTLIGAQALDPLPGFNSGLGETPNWTMASTSFDSTGFGDQYLIFWVLVWMEDANGELLAEIEGHGLTGLPAAEIDFITGVPIETYSNNVGFYKQPFFVIPAANTAEPSNTAVALPQETVVDALSVETVTVTPDKVNLYQKVLVSALLSTGEIAPGSAQVFFYDGDPEQGGKLFDVELIPYLRSNDQYLTQVAYKPAICGEQSIFVEVISGAPGAEMPVWGSVELIVNVEPKVAITSLIAQVRASDLRWKVKKRLIKKLKRVKHLLAHGKFNRAGRQFFTYLYFIYTKSGKLISVETADALLENAFNMLTCVKN